MKSYLIPILIGLMLASGVVVGCGQQESKQTVKQPTSELLTYIAKEKPVSERHVETLQVINKAIKVISLEAEKPSPNDPSKTQLEAIELPNPPSPTSIQPLTAEALVRSLTGPKTPPEPIIPRGLKEALTSGIDTLDWALERMDFEIRDYQILNPPPEAKTYHCLTVEVLLKEQAIYSDIRSNYTSLLSNGYSDIEALDRVKETSLERDRLWSLIQHEWDELVKEDTVLSK